MSEYIKEIKNQKITLYSNILLLSRNKIFYTKFNLIDTFQNRINLIFLHISFIFIKVKQDKKSSVFKFFYQEMFDLIFDKIELNMREIGYGDSVINKNMRYLVKSFYNILLTCEKYKKMSKFDKGIFLSKYLSQKNTDNITKYADIISYFDKYDAFCFDLSCDSVLSGELKFKL